MRQIRYIWLLVGVLLAGMLSAQNVSQASFYQDGEKVVISYTLDKVASVTVQVSTDGGATFSAPLKHVSGDVGENVKTGNNRIVWDALKEYEKVVSNRVQFLITATDGSRSSLSSSSGGSQHEYVDLGLPSGTLWATCNVGANKPEEYGDYFAWGEITPKSTYSWKTYRYYMGESNNMVSFSKYSTYSTYGRADKKYVLDLADDAAHANLEEDWRMPTRDEIEELRTKCTWTWTTLQGVTGYVVKGSNGKSIFLPAASYKTDRSGYENRGYYWSSSLKGEAPIEAYQLYFSPKSKSCAYGKRYLGMTIRPVRSANAANQAQGSTRSGVLVRPSTSQSSNHEYVDLGLSSGTLWATCNVGANRPSECGDYFAWGETRPKSTYSKDTYKYNSKSYRGVLDFANDAARAHWGAPWRMPTREEMRELCWDCKWTRTTYQGVTGYIVKGPNGNSIFLPAASYQASWGKGSKSYGYYWTASLKSDDPSDAYYLYADDKDGACISGERYYGYLVRPVRSSR